MKQILISFIFVFCGLYSLAQNSVKNSSGQNSAVASDKTTLGQYRKTFEIKNNSNPDKATLSKIDISKYDNLRKDLERVQATDELTGFTIVLYSNYEIKHGKNTGNELQVLPNDHLNDTAKSYGQ